MNEEQVRERADVCTVACAEAFRGDGEILASAFGLIPRAGVSLARLTFSPDLLQTDGEAGLVAEPFAVGTRAALEVPLEGWMPFRRSFDVLWSGRRHALLGAIQLDRYGSANLSAIGDWSKPRVQLIGVRGLPGNTLNHPCSYWVARHSKRVFVERVDMVSGVGYNPDDWPDGVDRSYHEIRRVVTDLAVLDFESQHKTMRLRSVHPGVSVDEVCSKTGFSLDVPDDVPTSRLPTDEERRLLDEIVDPSSLRLSELAR